MTASQQTIFRLVAYLGVLLAGPGGLAAEVADVPVRPDAPRLRSPVDAFRELLAMNPAQRRQVLTNRPAEARKRILAKVREYESLNERERDLRLRATELQWYLMPLMSLSSSNRAARLALIPPDDRKLVEERLAGWDRLAPVLQQQLLNDQITARYFTQLQTGSDPSKMSPERRARLEAGLESWRGLSVEQREKTLAGFNAFFELTPREREKALNTLPENEQQRMQKTLAAYIRLRLVERMQAIRSFEKFTSLSIEERQVFLKSAERWKLMSDAERDAWRKLSTAAPLQPPLPPGNHDRPLIRLPARPPVSPGVTNPI